MCGLFIFSLLGEAITVLIYFLFKRGDKNIQYTIALTNALYVYMSTL